MAAVAVDLRGLAELIAEAPDWHLAGPEVSAEDLAGAEAQLGALPPSYRWFLARGARAVVAGEPVAGLAPVGTRGAVGDITEPWRRGGGLLCFHTGADGEAYCFERDSTDPVDAGTEQRVVVVDQFGDQEPFADSFAGFLTRHEALRRGLGEGPVPDVAQLWRSTPGLYREDGLTLYGPQSIAERNQTYEVAEYAPDWVMVGDDSGGSGLFVRHHGADRRTVWRLGMGAICPEVEELGTRITGDLIAWLATGTPLPE